MPEEVAGIPGIDIAFVLDPHQILSAGKIHDLLARGIKERAQNTRSMAAGKWSHHRHGSGTTDAGSPQKIEEKGLGLVVAMVRQNQPFGIHFCKSLVTGSARSPLKPLVAVALHGYLFHVKPNSPCLAQLLAERLPSIRIRADTVVDMQCGQMESMPSGQS